MSIGWNLPPGVTPEDCDAAQGFSGDDSYDDYCNDCAFAGVTPLDLRDWIAFGRPPAPDPCEEDAEYNAYCIEVEQSGGMPVDYLRWLDGEI